MQNYQAALQPILSAQPTRIVLSAPRPEEARLVRAVATRVGTGWQIETLTKTQAFHQNLKTDSALLEALANLLQQSFTQITSHGPSGTASIRISKKGKLLTTHTPTPTKPPQDVNNMITIVNPKSPNSHNRQKPRLLPEGVPVPPLIDMGIFTAAGTVAAGMHDKYRQINRFLEIIDDALRPNYPKTLTIIDFGCGKSYLTFILYHYLAKVKGINATITGLDLKADVVQNCNDTAQKYGYTGLSFAVGDIATWQPSTTPNMVITLHACNTATDLALANAVKWGAGMIFSVPCCQHELNEQMHTTQLALLTRYGIVKERTAALFTDAIRGALLEACGYKTQLLEFVDFAHTPKNILIRAVQAPRPAHLRAGALAEVHALMQAFGFKPTLYTLLEQQGRLSPVK